jgi:L-ascorbate metabolism protein UlaG (beta-lactamase superfamily)
MLRPLVCLLLSLPAAPAVGQDEKPLILRWFGQSMFQLETGAGKKVVFDPHLIPEFGRRVVDADIVLLSHRHTDHTQLGAITDAKAARVFQGLVPAANGKGFDWAKVDEKVGPVQVRGVPLYHDTEAGMSRGKVTAFVVTVDGRTVCHLGDLGHELTPGQVKAIGPVDVLLVPVGGIYTLNGEVARKVVEQVKPKLFAVPMHYGVPGYDELLSADEFLDGQPRVKRTDGNELVIPPDASGDGGYTVAVLGWKGK